MIDLKTQKEALQKMLLDKEKEINIIKDMIFEIDKEFLREEVKNKELFKKVGMFPDSECDILNDLFNNFGKIYNSKK